ncbi:TyrR/PhhR family helix-turn-helix DNA-binding protein [Marinomonas epiphytica]
MRLEIQCEDRIGMIREVLDLFIPHQIDLRLIEVSSSRRCVYCGFSDVNFQRLQKLLADLRRLKDVEDVKTVSFTPSEQEANTLATVLEALPEGVIALDTKGVITLATKRASEDLNTPLYELIGHPLQEFIKGINFTKSTWNQLQQGISKQVKISSQIYLLEMKPIWVASDEKIKVLAGAVIHLKSQARLARQTENFKQEFQKETRLKSYFSNGVCKSAAMQRLLQQAQSFIHMQQPLLITGELGSGKKDLVQAMYLQAKLEWHHESECVIKAAEEISEEDILALVDFSGWYVIENVEKLSKQVQKLLTKLLKERSRHGAGTPTSLRLVSVSGLNQQALLAHPNLDSNCYFALANLYLDVPPLKNRREDIPALAQQCFKDLAARYQKPLPKLTKGAWAKLTLHTWPGNMIELENYCRQLLMSLSHIPWEADDIPLYSSDGNQAMTLVDGSLDKTIKQWEADLLKRLYPKYPSTRKLAKAVGMSHSAIANKLKEFGIALD